MTTRIQGPSLKNQQRLLNEQNRNSTVSSNAATSGRRVLGTFWSYQHFSILMISSLMLQNNSLEVTTQIQGPSLKNQQPLLN